MPSRRTALATLLTAACGVTAAVTAAPASASDETLKAQIVEVLPQVTPSVKAFVTAAKKAEKTGDLEALGNATDDVRTAISLYKWSVVNRKASTDEGTTNKQQLLVAIREYDIGFAAYSTALDKASSGASKATTLKSLKTFAKRISEAIDDEATALQAFGIGAASA